MQRKTKNKKPPLTTLLFALLIFDCAVSGSRADLPWGSIYLFITETSETHCDITGSRESVREMRNSREENELKVESGEVSSGSVFLRRSEQGFSRHGWICFSGSPETFISPADGWTFAESRARFGRTRIPLVTVRQRHDEDFNLIKYVDGYCRKLRTHSNHPQIFVAPIVVSRVVCCRPIMSVTGGWP